MRLMRCVVDEMSVIVREAEYAERFGHGRVVDFDRVLIPADPDAKPPREAYTLEHALGHHAERNFEPYDETAAQRVATHQQDTPADAPVQE